MLLAGIGWGTMPSHRIAGGLAAGGWSAEADDLGGLRPASAFPCVAHRRDRALGPAGAGCSTARRAGDGGVSFAGTICPEPRV